jgi:hypothetical protein
MLSSTLRTRCRGRSYERCGTDISDRPENPIQFVWPAIVHLLVLVVEDVLASCGTGISDA